MFLVLKGKFLFGYKGNLYYPGCRFYSRMISTGMIKSGDKCIWIENIERDLERYVLGYEPRLRNITEELMRNPVREK